MKVKALKMKEKSGCAHAALIISTRLTQYKWRKILDVNIWPQGQLLHSLFIYWRQTSQSGSTQVDFCLRPPCSQTLIEWWYLSKLSIKPLHNWATAFGRDAIAGVILPDGHPGSAWRGIRRRCGHFLLVQFAWRRSVKQSIHTAAWEPQRGLDMINQPTDQRA